MLWKCVINHGITNTLNMLFPISRRFANFASETINMSYAI